MRLIFSLLFCLVLVSSCTVVGIPAPSPDVTHPFSIHDMLAMDRLSDPQVSPDGKRIVFVRRKTDLGTQKRFTAGCHPPSGRCRRSDVANQLRRFHLFFHYSNSNRFRRDSRKSELTGQLNLPIAAKNGVSSEVLDCVRTCKAVVELLRLRS